MTCGSLTTAIEAAREFRPDAILTGIELPEMDGFEMAERLRSRPETSGALLIAPSGRAGEDNWLRAMEVGFDHYSTRSVRFAEVEGLLASPRRAHQARGTDLTHASRPVNSPTIPRRDGPDRPESMSHSLVAVVRVAMTRRRLFTSRALWSVSRPATRIRESTR